jgi:hypothetical protein
MRSLPYSSAVVSQVCNQGVVWASFLIGDLTREKWSSKLIKIVGRIGLRALTSCWLSAGNHLQHLKATHSSYWPPAVLGHLGFPNMASSSIQKGEFLGASMLEHSHLIKT